MGGWVSAAGRGRAKVQFCDIFSAYACRDWLVLEF